MSAWRQHTVGKAPPKAEQVALMAAMYSLYGRCLDRNSDGGTTGPDLNCLGTVACELELVSEMLAPTGRHQPLIVIVGLAGHKEAVGPRRQRTLFRTACGCKRPLQYYGNG